MNKQAGEGQQPGTRFVNRHDTNVSPVMARVNKFMNDMAGIKPSLAKDLLFEGSMLPELLNLVGARMLVRSHKLLGPEITQYLAQPRISITYDTHMRVANMLAGYDEKKVGDYVEPAQTMLHQFVADIDALLERELPKFQGIAGRPLLSGLTGGRNGA